ncbi:serine/threonine-protein kinase [Cellulomonas pakistanensis]|uniref:non-specific serine/threonine protein kinase n=1 Tax=Cellulomonas pakistanensis TaxID=992287 RepID=A0A919P9C1_9CELL|nr:serine/threonine-protein kinase [Cellulomonas pakistanensis]GIG36765.1 serine/threonine protein kinase [Cellulomonas pakistanensis]
MNRRREASQPPHLPGYAVQRLLGSGGSADVFLYEQDLPRRPVAVKVLLGSVDAAAREAFEREADLTARLSHHPSIVTVHQAGVAGDGRPYLVMEYCARPGLGQRYRSERFAVAEVLELGVRLASAVETAHRAGILHRDIKPGNVLTNDFGRPVLTDFGIASTVDAGGPAVGMSIPWAAPELLAAAPHGDARSDVYSLAATLFSALAGRSPFERPGGGNEAADLVGRIERGAPVPFARDDVPDRLRTVLARAMAREPQQRHARAFDLAQDLRAVQADLGLPVTALDVDDHAGPAGAAGAPSAGAPADATRARPVVEIAPQGGGPDLARPPVAAAAPAAAPQPVGPPLDLGSGPEATRLRPVVAVRPDAAPAPAPGPELVPAPVEVHPGGPSRSRTGRVLAAVGSVVAIAAAVVALVLLTNRPDATPGPDAGTEFPGPASTLSQTVPAPTNLFGSREADGTVVFTWTNPDEQEGDTYLWGLRTATGEPQLQIVEEQTVTVTPEAAGEVCIEVSVVRADRRASTVPAEGCVP